MTLSMQQVEAPIGTLVLVADDRHLLAIIHGGRWPRHAASFAAKAGDTPLLRATKRQLGEYFAGDRRDFDLPFALRGTPFQTKVWSELCRIPYGETRTYKEQAVAIDAPGAARAVGAADGMNLLSIVVPCHRVVGTDGRLTGYAGGLAAKRFLLELEARALRPT